MKACTREKRTLPVCAPPPLRSSRPHCFVTPADNRVLSKRTKPILVSGIQVEPFIAKSRSSPPSHLSQTSIVSGNGYTRFRPDSVYSGRVLSIPDGYDLSRTDFALSERMQDIRGVSGVSI